MLPVPVGPVMGKSQQDHGANEEQPAVTGKPHGQGKTSQAETGQDQGQLSAEGRIGRSLARMAGAGFRARVLGYDPSLSHEEMRMVDVQKHENLQEMLA